MISSRLQEVTLSGTAPSAKRSLGRGDIFGKTGTTNDSMDAWFAGFHPSLVAVVWIGYDTPRKLGDKETGGGLALPVWIDYMRQALKGVPARYRRLASKNRRRASSRVGANIGRGSQVIPSKTHCLKRTQSRDGVRQRDTPRLAASGLRRWRPDR